MSNNQIRPTIELIPEKQAESDLFIKVAELIDHEVDNFALAITDVANKYTDPTLVTKEVVTELFIENGLKSVVDLFDAFEEVDHNTVLAFSAYILLYKGHRTGYETVLRLMGFEYTLEEWWESGEQEACTFSLDVNLNASAVTSPYATFQKIKRFTSEYVFPIIYPLGFTITIPMFDLAWLHMGFAHQTFNVRLENNDPTYQDIMGFVELPDVGITLKENLLFNNTNFIMEDSSGQKWNVKFNNDGEFKAFKQAVADVTPKFSILKPNGSLAELSISTEGVLSAINSTSEIPQRPSFYLTSRDTTKWVFKVDNANNLTIEEAKATLTATATPNAVALQWFNPFSSAVYDIYRSVDNIDFVLIAQEQASGLYNDRTIDNGVVYYYRLQNVANSVEKIELVIKAIGRTVTNFTVVDKNDLLTRWDEALGADGYRMIAYDLQGVLAFTQDVGPTIRELTLTGLAAGTQYDVSVNGFNSIGNGTTLVLGSARMLTSPETPALPIYDITSIESQVKFSWPAILSAINYEIYKDSGSGFVLLATVTNLNYTNTALVYGGNNLYRIRAFNGTYSSYSPVLTVRQPALTSIASVTALVPNEATVTINQALLANRYELLYRKIGDVAYTIIDTTSLVNVVTGLDDYTDYEFVAVGISDTTSITRHTTSAADSIKTVVGPVLSDITLTADYPAETLTLDWEDVLGAVSYKIYRSISGSVVPTFYGSTANSTFTDGPLESGSFYYSVKAVDSLGRESVMSDTVSFVYDSPITVIRTEDNEILQTEDNQTLII